MHRKRAASREPPQAQPRAPWKKNSVLNGLDLSVTNLDRALNEATPQRPPLPAKPPTVPLQAARVQHANFSTGFEVLEDSLEESEDAGVQPSHASVMSRKDVRTREHQYQPSESYVPDTITFNPSIDINALFSD